MTSPQFRAALAHLGWSLRQLAGMLGCSVTLPAKWATGRASVPPAVAVWLARLAAYHEACPAPEVWRVREAA